MTIIENPVESISAVAKRDLMQDIDCEIWEDENGIEHSYYNFYNLFEYTVVYDGGKVFTGDVKEIKEKFGYWIRICDEQSEGNQFVLGKNTVEIEFIGVRGTAEFNITECLYKAVEISGENELTVTFIKTDNTKVSAQVINFEESDGGLGGYWGTLETTAGTFYANFNWKTEETDDNAFEYKNEDLQLVIGKLQSNKINCNYIKALLDCHELIDCKSYFEGTGENYFSFNNKNYSSLEALAWIACRFNGTGWSGDYITNGYKKYYLLDVGTVKNSIKEVFGVEVDVTASEDYDAETGKYRWFNYYYYSDNYNYRKIKFENGIWTYKQINSDNQGICIKLNEDFTVNSINMCNKETHATTVIFREDATCTTDGFILSECDICGEIVEEVIPAIGHNYKEEVIEATEASNGKIVYTCENCGHSYTEIIPSVGQHNFVVIKEKDSTCTSAGYIVYKCSLCGETKTEKKAALPHSYKIRSKIDATYTHMGQITSECEHCGTRNIEIVYAFCDFNKDGLLNQSDYNAFDIKTADISLFDFDKNGEVDEFDTVIIKHLTNNTAFTEIIDINGDGKSDIKDLVRAKKILAGIIPEDDNNDADKNLDGNTTAEDIIFVRKFILTIDLKLYT